MTLPLQTQAALIRTTAFDILLAANTIAGDRIEQEEIIDPVADGDTPRLAVMMDESGTIFSRSGGPPRFTMSAKLTVQCLVQDAVKNAAVARADQIVSQVKYALLTNPAFTALCDTVDTVSVTHSFKPGSNLVTADARVQMSMTYFEYFAPDLTGTLSAIVQAATLSAASTVTATTNF